MASFLAGQEGLKFIFLNGCSSEQHAIELIQAGIPAVVGTFQSIADDVAANLSIRFYSGIANGFPIERAWKEAIDYIKVQKGTSNFRDLYWQGRKDKDDRFPWDIFYKPGGEKVKGWNLPEAANDPLFGLPEIPAAYGLPESPFLFLKHYERPHAKIFFGRSYYIRNLYNRITDSKSPVIILLYGQSGVGKSSLLDAGLMPRLEDSHMVVYTRRIRERGLLGTLQEAINEINQKFCGGPGRRRQDNFTAAKWKLIESETGKPLVIILDQAEEMYTHPNKELPNEFEDFLAVLKEIFGNPASCPRSKLILGYRKEYHPEIDKQFRSYELPRSWLFLEPLSRRDIMEVVTGLTRTSELKQRYNNIEVEEDLPVIIADDLLEDKNSPIAPVLQILLTKMWHSTLEEETPNARFTVEKYRQLNKEGIAMEDFFNQQMVKLRAWNPDVVDSGLALDLLKFHTTDLGTSCSRNIKNIRQTYSQNQNIIENLVQELKGLYLLTDARHSKEETCLTHDTLAPIVIKEYNDSDKPGQRAARILATKIEDFKRNEDKVWLDEADLEIVEQGRKGKRAFDKNEENLLQISRQHKVQREKVKKRIRRIGAALISVIFIVAVIAVIQWERALEKTRTAKANYLASQAQLKVKEDPTIALRLAEKAYQLDKSKTTTETIHKIYRENNFYKIFAKHISTAIFSPDGKYILTKSEDGTFRLWDLQGKEFQIFKGQKKSIYRVTFSPNSKHILSKNKDGTVQLWNLQGHQLQVFAVEKNRITSATFSPDSNFILTAGYSDKEVRLWDLQGKELHVFRGHKKGVASAAFSPDSKYVLTTEVYGKTARLWEWMGKELRVFNTKKEVHSTAFSPDGKYILIRYQDNSTGLWDWQGKELQVFEGHEEAGVCAVFSPDGEKILNIKYGTVHLWNLEGKELQSFKGPGGMRIHSAIFSPDGNYILIVLKEMQTEYASINGAEAGTVNLWDLQSNKTQPFSVYKDADHPVAISPDGKYILSSTNDRTARLWNFKGKELQFKGHKDYISSVSFSPDGNSILTISRDKTLCLWILQARELLELQAFIKGPEESLSFAFSPGGKYIITTSSDRGVRLWNLQGQELQFFKGHKKSVNSVTFSRNGKHILTMSYDSAHLLDLQGNRLQVFGGDKNRVISAGFSPDDKYILTESEEKGVCLWSLQGKELQSIKGFFPVFSPNSKYILTRSKDKTAQLWDLGGDQLQEFERHKEYISYVSFSPDSKYILTGSDDGTVYLWDLQGNIFRSFSVWKYTDHPAAFSPNSKYIITISEDRTAQLWDLQGKELKTFQSHVFPVFSPDNRYILTGSPDKTACLWDLDGNQLQEFKGHKSFISYVSFSPDDKYILTGTIDGILHLWELKMPLEDFLKKGLFEKLSAEQKREYGIED